MKNSGEFAIVRAGGKRFKAVPGQKITVDQAFAGIGDEITLTEIVLVSNGSESKVGTPLLDKVSVKAKVIAHRRGPKAIIYKKRRTKGYTKKQGHRQDQTVLLIESIKA